MIEYIDTKYVPDSKDDYVVEYYVELNGISLEKAAEQIAAESSIGTWTDISTLSPELALKLKPHVFSINAKTNIIKIAYQRDLFEDGSVSQILSSIAGNIYGMKAVKNLRLLDIDFPTRSLRHFPGPRFGIEGIRKLTKIKERPLVGTIVKPKVGLSPLRHAQVAFNAWNGGLDVVKDDENLTNQKFNPFEDRIVKTLEMRDRSEEQTGEKKIYMPNVTAETAEMIKRADFVKNHGGEYVMIDVLTAGFSGLQSLRRHCHQFIHGHRAMHGAITRNPKHGMSMLALGKFSRLAGIDQLHVGTAIGKMDGSPEEVIDVKNEIEEKFIREKGHVLEENWGNIKPAMAVSSGGLHPGHIQKLVELMGKNIVIQAGGGCHGHPDGTEKGARALRQAVDAVMEGTPVEEYATRHRELDKALLKWGFVK